MTPSLLFKDHHRPNRIEDTWRVWVFHRTSLDLSDHVWTFLQQNNRAGVLFKCRRYENNRGRYSVTRFHCYENNMTSRGDALRGRHVQQQNNRAGVRSSGLNKLVLGTIGQLSFEEGWCIINKFWEQQGRCSFQMATL